MEKLHFTLGDDAGLLLSQIAWERMFMDLSPAKAISIFVDSLQGLPYSLALELLHGDKVVEVSDKTSGIMSIVPYDKDKHEEYPVFDYTGWYERNHKWIGDCGRELYQLLDTCSRDVVSECVEVQVKNVIQMLLQHEDESVRDRVYEEFSRSPRVDRIVQICKSAEQYLRRVSQLGVVFDFIEDVFPNDVSKLDTGKHFVVSYVASKLSNLISLDSDALERICELEDAPIKNHVKAAIEISEKLKDLIQPVDILDNYSAGWLSPTGEYFGLNGEISNMLHKTIADAIRERMIVLDGVDPLEDDDKNMDGWLSLHGWVKIHGSWILYDGYMQGAHNMKVVPLTDIQIEKISLYGKVCHGDKLFCGLEKKFCSGTRFGFTEKPMLAKLFDAL